MTGGQPWFDAELAKNADPSYRMVKYVILSHLPKQKRSSTGLFSLSSFPTDRKLIS